MSLTLSKLSKPDLSVSSAPYRVTLKSGKQFFYSTLREIVHDFPVSRIEQIYDRHKRRVVDLLKIGRRERKRKHEQKND
jgi:hypothetical protein